MKKIKQRHPLPRWVIAIIVALGIVMMDILVVLIMWKILTAVN